MLILWVSLNVTTKKFLGFSVAISGYRASAIVFLRSYCSMLSMFVVRSCTSSLWSLSSVFKLDILFYFLKLSAFIIFLSESKWSENTTFRILTNGLDSTERPASKLLISWSSGLSGASEAGSSLGRLVIVAGVSRPCPRFWDSSPGIGHDC